MREYNQETVSDRFVKLPESVQDAILSDTLTNEIRKATEAAGISGENKKRCVEQITLVSVGLSTIKDFREFVQTSLKLPREKASSFEDAISKNVFEPIKRALVVALQNPPQGGSVTTAVNGTMGETSTKSVDPYREVLG